jgi:hypothetical protein
MEWNKNSKAEMVIISTSGEVYGLPVSSCDPDRNGSPVNEVRFVVK